LQVEFGNVVLKIPNLIFWRKKKTKKKTKKTKNQKQSKNNEKLVQGERCMDWVKKLQRERSHIATITMNPKFIMFLTSIVVVGDHNYRKRN